MRKENLEKCLAIYKKNDRSRHITLPEMKKFLKNELGMKIPSKMNKPEVNKIFNDNLSVATYEKYESVGRFGMVRMDIQEALGLTLKEARELAKTLKEKSDVRATSNGYNIYISIYDMEDVLKLMDEGAEY